MRAWAVQFELAYTDFRTIQLALQLAQDQHDLLVRFTGVYDTVSTLQLFTDPRPTRSQPLNHHFGRCCF
jgi:hypothetical protein